MASADASSTTPPEGPTPDIVFLTTYACPRCGVELAAGPRQMQTWLRCPACGRPALPPAYTPGKALVVGGSMDDDTLFIGPLFDPPAKALEPERPAAFSAGRIVVLLLAAVSVSLLIDSIASRNRVNAVIAAVLGAAAVFGTIWRRRGVPRG